MAEIVAQMVLWLIGAIFGAEKVTRQLSIPIPTETEKYQEIPHLTPTPKLLPTPTLKPKQVTNPTPDDPRLPKEWGVAKQIGEHTWTMRVGMDEKMATEKEIFAALNDYRRRFGVAELMWDDKLAIYAKDRADYFVSNNGLDAHKGFGNYLENEDGFNKLGFNALGENSAMGYRMTGTHLIEWIFAGDEPHNKNQLNKDWAYVGVGVNQEAVDIIFGTGKF